MKKKEIASHTDRENWDYTELATSHLPMVTHPNELNKLLLNIANH